MRWSLPAVMADRPRIRINQLGFLPQGPKRATWITESTEPTDFVVLGPGGPVLSGLTRVWPVRPEPSSDQTVHVLDLSALTTPSVDLVVRVGEDRSHPFRIDGGIYATLARDALGVFFLLRSGCAIDGERAAAYARPAGHLGVPPNRGDTAVRAWTGSDAKRLYPEWTMPGTYDVHGGWYDAGDYGKYATSGSIAVWQLLNVLPLLRCGQPSMITEATLIEECRWQLDWLLRMQVPPGRPLAGMVFHRVHGSIWSPMPGLPHEDPTERVLHRPSTTATFHLAAVAGQAARLLRSVDAAYADRLLAAARVAYRAASEQPVLIAPDDQGRFGGGPYGDPDPSDDAYWAAVELWLATGEAHYLEALSASPQHTADVFADSALAEGCFDYDRVAACARLDLADAGARLPDHDRVVDGVVTAGLRLLDLQAHQPWEQPYGPSDGWEWGSNGRILNNLVVLATAARLSGDADLRSGVISGVDYLLGRNALGQSYVVGYGTDSSRHPRTRQFGHDLDARLPPAPAGAITGGANSRPSPGFPYDQRLVGLAPQLCYLDEQTSEVTNDICIRWNAPLVYVASSLSL